MQKNSLQGGNGEKREKGKGRVKGEKGEEKREKKRKKGKRGRKKTERRRRKSEGNYILYCLLLNVLLNVIMAAKYPLQLHDVLKTSKVHSLLSAITRILLNKENYFKLKKKVFYLSTYKYVCVYLVISQYA